MSSQHLPASLDQERMWFASQYAGDLPVYQLSFTIDLLGVPLEAGDIEDCLATVVRRHEVLRTSLRPDATGRPHQLVETAATDALDHLDLRHLPRTDADTRVVEEMSAYGRRFVPLDRSPLWRARLIRVADADWWLVLTVHHAVFDAASYVLLRRELTELCRARVEGRAPVLPDLPIQYADFAAWQRGRLDDDLHASLDYWREALEGVPTVHAMPTDLPRSGEPLHVGDQVRLPLPDDLGPRLRSTAQDARATPFMVLLAAFVALVHRQSRATDVVVAVPTSGRDLPELAPLIGMFVNTLAVRVRVCPDEPFTALVERVRGTMLDALEHRGVPFQSVVDAAAPERTPGVAPLAQLAFNYIPDSGNEPLHNGTAKEDLALELSDRDCCLTYRTDLFDPTTARLLAERYLTLLTAAVTEPTATLGRLPLESATERAETRAWGQGAEVARPPLGPAELVAEAARRDPRAPAVISPEETLDRGALWARTEALAAALRERGIGAGAVVALATPRSVAGVVAQLAVLRAGAAYLPIDPSLPEARVALLVDAAAPALAVTAAGGPSLPPGVADDPRGRGARGVRVRALRTGRPPCPCSPGRRGLPAVHLRLDRHSQGRGLLPRRGQRSRAVPRDPARADPG